MHLHVLGRVLVKEVVVPALDTLGGAVWQHPMMTFTSLVFDRPPDMFGGWGRGWGGVGGGGTVSGGGAGPVPGGGRERWGGVRGAGLGG